MTGIDMERFGSRRRKAGFTAIGWTRGIESMVKGLNSDVMVQGSMYHVQTEDWGAANPYLVSRVYLNGAVVKSVKTAYRELTSDVRRLDTKALLFALREQHEKILDLLVSGQL